MCRLFTPISQEASYNTVQLPGGFEDKLVYYWEHLQISEGRSSDCSDVISEILVHISDQIGRSSVVYRICGMGIPKGQHPTHVHVSTSTEIRSSS